MTDLTSPNTCTCGHDRSWHARKIGCGFKSADADNWCSCPAFTPATLPKVDLQGYQPTRNDNVDPANPPTSTKNPTSNTDECLGFTPATSPECKHPSTHDLRDRETDKVVGQACDTCDKTWDTRIATTPTEPTVRIADIGEPFEADLVPARAFTKPRRVEPVSEDMRKAKLEVEALQMEIAGNQDMADFTRELKNPKPTPPKHIEPLEVPQLIRVGTDDDIIELAKLILKGYEKTNEVITAISRLNGGAE